jgi:predicted acetyltransferase
LDSAIDYNKKEFNPVQKPGLKGIAKRLSKEGQVWCAHCIKMGVWQPVAWEVDTFVHTGEIDPALGDSESNQALLSEIELLGALVKEAIAQHSQEKLSQCLEFAAYLSHGDLARKAFIWQHLSAEVQEGLKGAAIAQRQRQEAA